MIRPLSDGDSEGPLCLMAPFRPAILESPIHSGIAIPLGRRFSPMESRFSPSTKLEKKVEGDSESPTAILRIVNRIHDSRFAESPCERSLECKSVVEKIDYLPIEFAQTWEIVKFEYE